MTVTGKTIGENIKGVQNKNPEVIRPLDNPYSKTGGLAVLDTLTFKVHSVMLIEIISPSSTSAIGPHTAASGDTCPIEAPRDAPEKRPSVISATVEPSPIPAIADVGFNKGD